MFLYWGLAHTVRIPTTDATPEKFRNVERVSSDTIGRKARSTTTVSWSPSIDTGGSAETLQTTGSALVHGSRRFGSRLKDRNCRNDHVTCSSQSTASSLADF